LQSLDAGVMRPMHALVMQWADEGGALVFTGVEQLQAVLRALTPSGVREVDTGWWHLRLALLRLMHMQDDFELTALDYCVTYEVSPPPWVDPVCAFSHDGTVQDVFALDSRMLIPDTLVPPMLGRDLPHRFALQGVIEGDALPWLTSIQEQAHLGETISINCARLVRMDFAAAGSVLNWTSSMQALGHVLQFSQLHQLVAVFFNVVGIQEHAQVQPRHD
ncbi:MAG: STAS domain-containing protein, partial [Comamonas sp.]